MLSNIDRDLQAVLNKTVFIAGNTITGAVGQVPVILLSSGNNPIASSHKTLVHQVILSSSVNQNINMIFSIGGTILGTDTFFVTNPAIVPALRTQLTSFSQVGAIGGTVFALTANVVFNLIPKSPFILNNDFAGGTTLKISGTVNASTLSYFFMIEEY